MMPLYQLGVGVEQSPVCPHHNIKSGLRGGHDEPGLLWAFRLPFLSSFHYSRSEVSGRRFPERCWENWPKYQVD